MTWFNNKGCLTCVLSLISCVLLSQLVSTDKTARHVMNNYINIWRINFLKDSFKNPSFHAGFAASVSVKTN